MTAKNDYETHCCRFIEWQPEEVESIAISETKIVLEEQNEKSMHSVVGKTANSETVIAIARKNGVIDIARGDKNYFIGEVYVYFHSLLGYLYITYYWYSLY